jgi:phage gp46-like protein
MVDIDINDIENELQLDFSFNDRGDIKTTDSFEPSIVIALFGNKEQDVILGDGGSELFKLDQARLISDTLSLYRFYTKESLAYLYDAKRVSAIKTNVRINSNQTLQLNITLDILDQDVVKEYSFRL